LRKNVFKLSKTGLLHPDIAAMGLYLGHKNRYVLVSDRLDCCAHLADEIAQ